MFPGQCPQPLRSEAQPWGLPDLAPGDQARVDSANSIYKGLGTFLEACSLANIHWSVENPERSLLWSIPPIKALVAKACFYLFQGCAWGGDRPTRKAFLSTLPGFCQLQAACPGLSQQHVHKPYGRTRSSSGEVQYATAEEAAYPKPLCTKIVSIVQQGLNLFPVRVVLSDGPMTANISGNLGSHKQPRGRKVKPLLTEFAHVHHVETSKPLSFDAKNCLVCACPPAPAGAKLVALNEKKGKSGATELWLYSLGVYREPEQWIADAASIQHPFDCFHAVPDDLLRVVFDMLTLEPFVVIQNRAEKLSQWLGWSDELRDRERALHSQLEPGVAAILEGKKLLLLERIAASLNWPDMAIFQEIRDGFKLVGLQPPSGIFSIEPRPSAFSAAELDDAGKFLRPAILGRLKGLANDEDQTALWDITLQESNNKHWMDGPLSLPEVEARHGASWIPVRRFGVWQSSGTKIKLRPIDDYSENRVNGAFAYSDKLELKALDQIIWMAAAITRSCRCGTASFVLSTGEKLEAPVSRTLLEDELWDPVATVLDLSSAYKQFAIHPSDRRYSIICMTMPSTKEVRCFEGRVLPFGATASVVHFNRISRLIHRIGLELLLPWGCYFDDFPLLSVHGIAGNTHDCATMLMRLLGFSFSQEKLKPFSKKAVVLGVEIDLEDVRDRGVLVRNKPGRLEEVEGVAAKLLEGDQISNADCSKLLGRLQCAEGQVMGRVGKLAMAELRETFKGCQRSITLSKSAKESFRGLLNRLMSGDPRQVPCSPPTMPIVVYTDGASDEGIHAVGGLIFAPFLDRPRFFSVHVPRKLTDHWLETMKHIIGPVELYAVVAARYIWRHILVKAKVIWYIDSFVAMDACIKGVSSNEKMRRLLLAWEEAEALGHVWSWFTRVPSKSNPADEPSRGCLDGLIAKLGAERDTGSCPLGGTPLQPLDTL